MAKIDILMATYNGEKYLSEQIDSILDQTFQDWRLVIHDDGSRDETVRIINAYVEKYPNKIVHIDDGIRTGGAKNNFFHLMKFVQAEYIMFSDQDDVWEKEKVEITYSEMKKNEINDVPCLVFTDLKVVDFDLNLISNSLKSYQKLQMPKNLEDSLLRNCVTGCTMMINSALYQSMTYPRDALMHDWWCMIEVFKSKGKLVFVEKSPILYRQHADNEVGARKIDFKSTLNKFLTLNKTLKFLNKQYRQFRLVSNRSFIYFISSKLSLYVFK